MLAFPRTCASEFLRITYHYLIVSSNPKIFLPSTPYEKRMAAIFRRIKVPEPDSLDGIQLQKEMERDIAFQLYLRSLSENIYNLECVTIHGGSRLQMSGLLRYYFSEYLSRYMEYGPDHLPMSFNVAEAFFRFHPQLMFVLRYEIEHLLSIDDYFEWYQKPGLALEPRLLMEVMNEGEIYSYDMHSSREGYRVLGPSEKVIAGVSFVRHEHELSCILLSGENPPFISSDDAKEMVLKSVDAFKKGITPNPEFSDQDRYLDGYPSYAKTIMLSRFDLTDGKYDVRYIMLDVGQSFLAITDDFTCYKGLPAEQINSIKKAAETQLLRYDGLFSALSSLIYLPVFLNIKQNHINRIDVSTDLKVLGDEKHIKNVVVKLGPDKCPIQRTINCLPIETHKNGSLKSQINPPEMSFKSDGYWRAIGPLEIGEGKKGEHIMGKTWVTRHESWSALSPQSFLIEKAEVKEDGTDPGIIYVQRSPSHEKNLYKVGLTRRDASTRASELSSSTSAPMPFAVLASWNVGNCGFIEKEVHRQLAAWRINPRREFFFAELSKIVRVIEEVIRKPDNPY